MGALRSLLHNSGNLHHVAGNLTGRSGLFFSSGGDLAYLVRYRTYLLKDFLERLTRSGR